MIQENGTAIVSVSPIKCPGCGRFAQRFLWRSENGLRCLDQCEVENVNDASARRTSAWRTLQRELATMDYAREFRKRKRVLR